MATVNHEAKVNPYETRNSWQIYFVDHSFYGEFLFVVADLGYRQLRTRAVLHVLARVAMDSALIELEASAAKLVFR